MPEFHSRLVYSRVLKTLTQVLDYMLEITAHTEFSINSSTKSLKSIMVMDPQQLILLK